MPATFFTLDISVKYESSSVAFVLAFIYAAGGTYLRLRVTELLRLEKPKGAGGNTCPVLTMAGQLELVMLAS